MEYGTYAGWFTDPSPFITGGLSPEQVSPVLNEAIQGAIEALGEGDEEDEDEEGVSQAAHPCTGMLSLRVTVCGADGSVKGVDFLADTLVGAGGQRFVVADLAGHAQGAAAGACGMGPAACRNCPIRIHAVDAVGSQVWQL